MEKFNKEQDELLIELVKCNSILHDASDKNFKNNILKHKIWENISESINIPISDCKKRWKNLRDHYIKKKKLDSSTGQARSSTNNWEYMTQLSFLSRPPTQKSTITNVSLELTPEMIKVEPSYEDMNSEIYSTYNSSSEQIDKAQNLMVWTSNTKSGETSNVSPNIVEARASLTSQGEIVHHAKKKKKLNSGATLIHILKKHEEERSELLAKLNATLEENPIKKFFESMGETVSKFPPHLAAETRLKVCQVVTEMELKMHQSASQTPTHSEDSS